MPTSELHDRNFGLDPEKADDLRKKAAGLLERLQSGDPEAERTLGQLKKLVAMAARDAGREV